MPRISLGFPTFVVVATAGGIGARLLWNMTGGHQEPPIWAPILTGLFVIPVALVVKVQVDRRARRGPHR
ncbi:hypothetical protein [Streptomyces microflavus]|uniref:hypothetical protein n=1 Tax=Streptomyces microflavus TaxID=1919 RepID=UPI003B210868